MAAVKTSLSCDQYAFCTLLSVMQLSSTLHTSNAALCVYHSMMLLTSTPHSLVMRLKDCSETTVLFFTPALKELGKGQLWFIILIVKTRCTHANKTFLVLLDHHQHHVFNTWIIPPFHLHIHLRWIKLSSLEKLDESLAPIKGPLENHQWKRGEVPGTRS